MKEVLREVEIRIWRRKVHDRIEMGNSSKTEFDCDTNDGRFVALDFAAKVSNDWEKRHSNYLSHMLGGQP